MTVGKKDSPGTTCKKCGGTGWSPWRPIVNGRTRDACQPCLSKFAIVEDQPAKPTALDEAIAAWRGLSEKERDKFARLVRYARADEDMIAEDVITRDAALALLRAAAVKP